MFLNIVSLLGFVWLGSGLEIAPAGFPVTWRGDEYYQYPMQVSSSVKNKFPPFLDGFFMGQLSASYGNQSNPPGEKLIHMFQAISGMVVFDLNPVQPKFSGKYYPTRQYHIWNFYDRDLTKSKVAWEAWPCKQDWNATQKWSKFGWQYLSYNPNVDFWKIGNTMMGGTEAPGTPGMTFNPATVSDFQKIKFHETSPIFTNPQTSKIQAWHMPIHERGGPAGSFYGSFSAVDRSLQQSQGYLSNYHYIFRVYPNKTRVVEAGFNLGKISIYSDCDSSGNMLSNLDKFSGYMHSITSTKNFILLPITSTLNNVCPQQRPKPVNNLLGPGANFTYVTNKVPMRWVVYNKNTKKFVTTAPIKFSTPLFVTHQWNAYEKPDGTIVADMIVYDYNVYNVLTPMKQLDPSFPSWGAMAWRFTVDTKKNTVTYSNLTPRNDTIPFMEFSQFNKQYEGLKYRYGYVVKNAYHGGSSIVKLDMDNPSKNPILEWIPGPTIAVTEPWFVPRPNSKGEDDGVLLVKGTDVKTKTARVYALDAKTMTLISSLNSPTVLPFGFHNRYYSRTQLGMKPTPTPAPTPGAASSLVASLLSLIFATLLLAWF